MEYNPISNNYIIEGKRVACSVNHHVYLNIYNTHINIIYLFWEKWYAICVLETDIFNDA